MTGSSAIGTSLGSGLTGEDADDTLRWNEGEIGGEGVTLLGGVRDGLVVLLGELASGGEDGVGHLRDKGQAVQRPPDRDCGLLRSRLVFGVHGASETCRRIYQAGALDLASGRPGHR